MELEQEDWCSTLKGKHVRAKVHDATKPRDVELGINCNGLTRHKNNSDYTKPHVFCQRLRLLQLLQQVWDQSAGSMEQRGEAVFKAYKLLWTSKLIPTQCFIKWSGSGNDSTRNIVLASGPHSLQYMTLRKFANSDPPVFGCAAGYELHREPAFVGDLNGFEICLAKATLTLDGDLGWMQDGDFMHITDYVATHNILWIQADLLARVCSFLKIRGHTKLGHKRRVEAFLRHMEKDDCYINEILDELPDVQPRPRADAAEERLQLLYSRNASLCHP